MQKRPEYNINFFKQEDLNIIKLRIIDYKKIDKLIYKIYKYTKVVFETEITTLEENIEINFSDLPIGDYRHELIVHHENRHYIAFLGELLIVQDNTPKKYCNSSNSFILSDGINIIIEASGLSGTSIEYNWKGTELGIKYDYETDFSYVDLKGKGFTYEDFTEEEIQSFKQPAIDAGLRADEATSNANIATDKANTASDKANDSAILANEATLKASNATTNANNATTNAITATANANTATERANTATTNANIATEKANNAKGWTLIHTFEADGVDREVQKLTDYIRGTGEKPTENIGLYVINGGYTDVKAQAQNFKGSATYTPIIENQTLNFASAVTDFYFATENVRTAITDIYIDGVRLIASQWELIRTGVIRVKSLPRSVTANTTYIATVIGKTSTDTQDFISLWEITDADKVITLPMTAGLIVDWGDGSVNTLNTHTYTTAGKKVISVKGAVTGFKFNNLGDRLKILEVLNWGTFNLNQNASFYGCSNINLSNVIGIPNVTVNSFNSMFRECEKLTSIRNFNNWNFSLVTALTYAFSRCILFNQPLTFNFSSINNASFMLSFATAFNQDISNLNYSGITNLASFMSGKTFNDYNAQYLTNLYKKLSETPTIQNLSLSFGTIKYTAEGQQYRNILTTRGNTITDGGVL